MRFTVKPTVRQLRLAFPVVLMAVPVAMSLAQDKPGPVLPPPSLYDAAPPGSTGSSVPPAAPSSAAPAPAVNKPVPAAAPAPVASKPAPAPVAKPAAAVVPVQAAPTGRSADTVADAKASEPWYKRWFGWLSPKPAAQTAMSAPAAPRAVVEGPAPGGRGEYAYDSPSRTIRTGMTGQCVRTGLWSPTAATSDCDPTMVAKRPPATATAMVARTVPVPVGSAPAPTPLRQVRVKPEPVEVVPLPPAPPAAREERALEPELVHQDMTPKEEMITALAESRPMPEPDFDKLTLSAGALFPLSSTNIKPTGREKLDELVDRLKEMEFETVRVVGHSDPTGPKAMNESLSKRRAQAVKNYLVSKGIDPKRIETAGKGGSEPLPKTADCDSLPRMEKIICYAPDRRVEIEVVGGKPQG
jgi:OmpA-OmpF porin, OOP family